MSGELLRALYPGDEPLPSSWIGSAPGIEVSPDGFTATYSYSSSRGRLTVAANNPAPRCEVYYLEVRIIAPDRKKDVIAVGFIDCPAKDGFTYTNGGRLLRWGDFVPKFKHGDVVGCGYRFGASRAFFTLNGSIVASKPYNRTAHLYAVLSMGTDEDGQLIGGEANFGQRPFLFDVFDAENISKLDSFDH